MSIYSIAYLECDVVAHDGIFASVLFLDEVCAWIYLGSVVECLHESFVVVVAEYLFDVYGLNEFDG